MTTVTFTTIPQAFPEGTIAYNYNVSILDSVSNVPVEAQNTNELVVTFTLNPGTYVASVQLMGSSGETLGAAVVSEAFTIAAPAPVTVELQVPASVVVTQ